MDSSACRKRADQSTTNPSSAMEKVSQQGHTGAIDYYLERKGTPSGRSVWLHTDSVFPSDHIPLLLTIPTAPPPPLWVPWSLEEGLIYAH